MSFLGVPHSPIQYKQCIECLLSGVLRFQGYQDEDLVTAVDISYFCCSTASLFLGQSYPDIALGDVVPRPACFIVADATSHPGGGTHDLS